MFLARVYNPLVQQNIPVPNFCWSNQLTAVRVLPLSWPLANLRGHTVRQWATVKPVLWAFTSLDLKGMLLKVPFASVVSWQSQDHVHFPESWPHPCGPSRLMNACLLGDSHILYLPNQLAPRFCWELALQDVSRLWPLVLSNSLLDTVNRKKLLVLSLPLQWIAFVFCGVFFIAQVSGFCSLNWSDSSQLTPNVPPFPRRNNFLLSESSL